MSLSVHFRYEAKVHAILVGCLIVIENLRNQESLFAPSSGIQLLIVHNRDPILFAIEPNDSFKLQPDYAFTTAQLNQNLYRILELIDDAAHSL